MKAGHSPELDRALTVPLTRSHNGTERRRSLPPGAAMVLSLLLLLSEGLSVAVGIAPLALALGLVLVLGTALVVLRNDFRYSLRVERGRVFVLRNGVAIYDASVLAEGGDRKLLLLDDRIEAVRCRPGEQASYVFGVPRLRAQPDDLRRIKERVSAEVSALHKVGRQIELLDDPDVQTHLRSRLLCEGRGRPSGLRVELLRIAQAEDGSRRAQAAQALLVGSHGHTEAAHEPKYLV